jgi:hypothetical protein
MDLLRFKLVSISEPEPLINLKLQFEILITWAVFVLIRKIRNAKLTSTNQKIFFLFALTNLIEFVITEFVITDFYCTYLFEMIKNNKKMI